jgi:hypothetical protein
VVVQVINNLGGEYYLANVIHNIIKPNLSEWCSYTSPVLFDMEHLCCINENVFKLLVKSENSKGLTEAIEQMLLKQTQEVIAQIKNKEKPVKKQELQIVNKEFRNTIAKRYRQEIDKLNSSMINKNESIITQVLDKYATNYVVYHWLWINAHRAFDHLIDNPYRVQLPKDNLALFMNKTTYTHGDKIVSALFNENSSWKLNNSTEVLLMEQVMKAIRNLHKFN